jgi:hypothetical protein
VTALARTMAATLLGLACAALGPSIVDEAVAEAQVWRPKKKAKKAKAKAKAPPVAEPEEDRDDVELPDEPQPDPPADLNQDDVEDEDETRTETESGRPVDLNRATIRMADELDDVGATVTFSEADLASDVADGDGRSVTRLETKGLAYARMAVDTVHDPVPSIGANLPATGEDVFAFRFHARAEGISRFGERIKIKVAGRADAELSLDADTRVGIERYQADVWDTYADLHQPHLDLRFGRQFVAWGTADLLSPNDVVNPRDLRRGALDRPDELRLPVLALSATTFDGPFALQAIWVPVAPTNRFELLEGDYALLGPTAATASERRVGAMVSALADDPTLGLAIAPILSIGEEPDHGLDTGELGARASVTLSAFDVHGYVFWGHERNPRIQLHPELVDVLASTPPDMLTPQVLADEVGMLAAMGLAPVIVDHPRRVHFGAAAAFRIEPLGIKLDAAYSPEAVTILVAPGLGPVLGQARRLPTAAATLSLDYDRGSDLSLIVEASHLRVLDVPTALDVYQARHDALTVLATRAEWTPGSGPISLSLLAFVDVLGPSYAIKPALRLSGHDNLAVELSAAIYGGPEATLGGVPDPNDEIVLSFLYGL